MLVPYEWLGKKWAAFFGRWSPFTLGHAEMLRPAVEEFGTSVWIGVRATPVSESDPWTVPQRILMIEAFYAGHDVIVTPIPDIESVNYSRGVGYEVKEIEVTEEIKQISATRVRQSLRDGTDEWRSLVPSTTAAFLEPLK